MTDPQRGVTLSHEQARAAQIKKAELMADEKRRGKRR